MPNTGFTSTDKIPNVSMTTVFHSKPEFMEGRTKEENEELCGELCLQVEACVGVQVF